VAVCGSDWVAGIDGDDGGGVRAGKMEDAGGLLGGGEATAPTLGGRVGGGIPGGGVPFIALE